MIKWTKIVAAVVLALGLIVATSMWGRDYIGAKKLDNVFTVNGQAKIAVVSDSARWVSSFSRTVTADKIKDGYVQLKGDENVVSQFLLKKGAAKDDFEISPVYMNEVWRNNDNAPKEYNLVQNVVVLFSDVNKAKELAKQSDQIASQGVIFSAGSVEYYYSKLAEAKIELLPLAIADAKARVEAIAKSAGKSVDNIQSVTMGVVQVMPAGSVDVSDYGSYDTSAINKDVMVTVKAVFNLK